MTASKLPLLLDVDGVVNVLAPSRSDIEDRGLIAHRAIAEEGRAYSLHIDPQVPRWLKQLSTHFEIVWCTTWANANQAISPLVGLPTDLDQVWLPAVWTDVPPDLCRKTEWVRDWAAEREVTRLAWLDDEVTPTDTDGLTRTWKRVERPRHWQRALAETPPLVDVLVISCVPHIGLTRQQVEALLRWEPQ